MAAAIVIVSLCILVELMYKCERPNLSEYGLSLVYDFCLLQYDLQKCKTQSRKKQSHINR